MVKTSIANAKFKCIRVTSLKYMKTCSKAHNSNFITLKNFLNFSDTTNPCSLLQFDSHSHHSRGLWSIGLLYFVFAVL